MPLASASTAYDMMSSSSTTTNNSGSSVQPFASQPQPQAQQEQTAYQYYAPPQPTEYAANSHSQPSYNHPEISHVVSPSPLPSPSPSAATMPLSSVTQSYYSPAPVYTNVNSVQKRTAGEKTQNGSSAFSPAAAAPLAAAAHFEGRRVETHASPLVARRPLYHERGDTRAVAHTSEPTAVKAAPVGLERPPPSDALVKEQVRAVVAGVYALQREERWAREREMGAREREKERYNGIPLFLSLSFHKHIFTVELQ